MPQPLILSNAVIQTMDRHAPQAQAIAIEGDRILAVGRLSDMPTGKVVDLGGRLVLPAFTDSHLHIMSWALAQDKVQLDGVPTRDAALALVAERARTTPTERWIEGWGWNSNIWDTGLPTRADLDRVAPNHPVALTRKDGHVLWVNSKALALAGVTRDTPHPQGGEIRRDAHGEPTGVLLENAQHLVDDVIPEADTRQRRAALQKAFPLWHRMGLVGGHEMGYADPFALWDDFRALKSEGRLAWRITHYFHKHLLDEMIKRGMKSWDGDHWLRVAGLKIFMDGTLGSQTADMLEDYEGQPGNRGIVTTEFEELRDLVFRGAPAGISVAVHAIGDAANHKVLDVLAELAASQGRSAGTEPSPFNLQPSTPLRHRIEHVQVLTPSDVPRLAQLGVIASVQPIHATSDMLIADKYWGARAETAYAYCSLLNHGTRLALGSDAPVETPDVMVGIHAAVTRQRADGTPPGGWYPAQRLSVHEAVHGYTLGAAYATGEEDVKGSLVAGKVADLVVLDRDIFTIDPAEILATQVQATMLGGEWVYGG